ncbi:conserved hypothetical protein [Talaromyces stipitatus ATCC 10500]|uniref:Uncharacterized protein n=1 Tax=Talaromyces stipitatus (strain ATCC 10500 / CBS 375.48 / QM 6759 / NRRL 1006) TaxID=441959 RepID=B8ME37_TALSN|nr:uncharacterized protein TSTA_012230 [Talaromyces stipitatus ATCC 10500]EED16114.1 conserved hypothetical protein [Talaromyces stipitatus ATCC 10500]
MHRSNYALPGLGISVCTFTLILAAWHLFFSGDKWRSIPQKVGLGDVIHSRPSSAASYYMPDGSAPPFNISEFVSGIPKKQGSPYSKTLVMAKTKEENTTWTETKLNGSGWDVSIYVVDDPRAPLHPPKNKGHEAMVYLTYIIDNYDNLPDIMAFMHAHQFAWHNEEIFEFDAAEMLRRLSLERVTREGYMNMRCYWSPGCPNWLKPGAIDEDLDKKEERLIAKAWSEIFPNMDIPQVLAQPCCAQFALSRERVRTIPRERFLHYRQWLINTDLRDTMSGRVLEYIWHLVFTGQEVSCPSQNACLCDGFGICFGGENEVNYYYQTLWRIRDANNELKKWQEADGALDEDARIRLSLDELADAQPSENDSQGILLTAEVEEKTAELARLKKEAFKRGEDPVYRAWAAGRQSKPGDGAYGLSCGHSTTHNNVMFHLGTTLGLEEGMFKVCVPILMAPDLSIMKISPVKSRSAQQNSHGPCMYATELQSDATTSNLQWPTWL